MKNKMVLMYKKCLKCGDETSFIISNGKSIWPEFNEKDYNNLIYEARRHPFVFDCCEYCKMETLQMIVGFDIIDC
jgi:hypothetical protein